MDCHLHRFLKLGESVLEDLAQQVLIVVQRDLDHNVDHVVNGPTQQFKVDGRLCMLVPDEHVQALHARIFHFGFKLPRADLFPSDDETVLFVGILCGETASGLNRIRGEAGLVTDALVLIVYR